MFPIVVNDGLTEFPKDDIYYIVCKEGVYLKKRLGIMESVAPVKNISILKSVQAMAQMHIKKMPAKYGKEIINFFKEVYKTHRAEAIVLIFYNQATKKYKIICPVQEVSAGAADYNRGIVIDDYDMIGTIHSHAGMSAFHSGVDDKDEESFDGIHITFGNMADDDISISASIVANGFRVIVDPRDYINNLELTVDIDEDEKVPYAKSWRWDKDQRKMVEITNKNKFYVRRKFDQRYQVKLAKDPKFDPKWMERVSKKVYTYQKWQQGWYGHGAHNPHSPHFDPDLWNGWGGHAVAGKTTTGKNGTSGAVTPASQAKPPVKAPVTPCDDCTFKHHKVPLMLDRLSDQDKKAVLAWALDQLESDADYTIRETIKDGASELTHYHCKACSGRFTIDELEADPVCPTCGVDDHLEEISAGEILMSDVEFAEEAADEPSGEIGAGMNIIYCTSCGSSYSSDFLNGGIDCPVCNNPLPSQIAASEDAAITQASQDSGSFLDSDREAIEAAAAADKEVERIPVPHQAATPINNTTKPKGLLASIFNRKK